VYLERRQNPINNQSAASITRNADPFSASQNVNMAANQKNRQRIDSHRNAPILKIGVTFNAMTAQKPAVALNNRRAK
jgi:hypothetical protein